MGFINNIINRIMGFYENVCNKEEPLIGHIYVLRSSKNPFEIIVKDFKKGYVFYYQNRLFPNESMEVTGFNYCYELKEKCNG